MQRNRKIYLAKVAALMAVVPAVIIAHSSGPDPRNTNGPGDRNCTQAGCHAGTALNTGGGSIEVTATPSNWTPGTKVTINVKVTDSAARVFGFQASTRLSSDQSKAQAGSFTAGSEQFVQCEDGRDRPASGTCPSSAAVEFIQHSSPSTTGNFTFTWTPPSSASVGDVVLFVAGNAANGNGQADRGDHIYATTLTLKPGGNNRPAISTGGLADNWTYTSGVAPATWMVLFGENFAPAGSAIKTWDGDPSFNPPNPKLPTSLNGTSVTVNGKAAPIYYVLPTQLAFLAPQDIGTGSVQVVVTTSTGGASDPLTVNAGTTLPAFYSAQADANGRFSTTAVQPATNPPVYLGKRAVDGKSTRPVRPGEIISLYGTGFGPTTPAVASDAVGFAPAQLVNQAVIRFGDTVAEQVTAGFLISPGLYQFNVKVPDTVPDGDITLTAQVGSVTSSSKLYITVQK